MTADTTDAKAILGADAAIELRQETRDELLAAYVATLMHAQDTHDPWAWMQAGSFFKRYAAAAIAAETGGPTA